MYDYFQYNITGGKKLSYTRTHKNQIKKISVLSLIQTWGQICGTGKVRSFLPKTLALAKGGNSSDWLHTFLCSCQRFWWSFLKSLYLFHTVIYRDKERGCVEIERTLAKTLENQNDSDTLYKTVLVEQLYLVWYLNTSGIHCVYFATFLFNQWP